MIFHTILAACSRLEFRFLAFSILMITYTNISNISFIMTWGDYLLAFTFLDPTLTMLCLQLYSDLQAWLHVDVVD